MRGIFFSLDGILALMISLLLIGAVFSAIDSISRASIIPQSLASNAKDTLAVLEKSGALKESVAQNSYIPSKQALDLLPSNACYSFSIFKGISPIPLIASQNCGCKVSFIAQRGFVISPESSNEPDEYTARLSLCQKVIP